MKKCILILSIIFISLTPLNTGAVEYVSPKILSDFDLTDMNFRLETKYFKIYSTSKLAKEVFELSSYCDHVYKDLLNLLKIKELNWKINITVLEHGFSSSSGVNNMIISKTDSPISLKSAFTHELSHILATIMSNTGINKNAFMFLNEGLAVWIESKYDLSSKNTRKMQYCWGYKNNLTRIDLMSNWTDFLEITGGQSENTIGYSVAYSFVDRIISIYGMNALIKIIKNTYNNNNIADLIRNSGYNLEKFKLKWKDSLKIEAYKYRAKIANIPEIKNKVIYNKISDKSWKFKFELSVNNKEKKNYDVIFNYSLNNITENNSYLNKIEHEWISKNHNFSKTVEIPYQISSGTLIEYEIRVWSTNLGTYVKDVNRVFLP